jgi:Mn2+/Fe2+ NRAMP family transporter
MIGKIKNTLSGLGPGLLYAGAAVGVSHLVMSTKAGALYSFWLLILIPLIHVIKYPFYKFGPEYTAITGKNILHGYKALGKWAVWLYIVMTIITMCLIQAAVTIVTSSIAVKFFKLDIPDKYMPHVPAIVVLLIAGGILAIGRYSILDKLMKVIILILTITTVVALSMVLFKSPEVGKESVKAAFSLGKYADVMFLAAFLGWMPAPMDISVWHSVWSEESNKAKGEKASMLKAMFDFRVGYIGTACLAMCFLALGAMVMFGDKEPISGSGIVFAGQLINMYTRALGDWAYYLIGIAALATMFSTTLTCLDAYPRTLEKSFLVLKNSDGGEHEESSKKTYLIVLALALIGTITAFLIIKNEPKAMGLIILTATVVSFISAPILAILNYLVFKGSSIPEENKPKGFLKSWCLFGIVVLTISSVLYIWVAFIKEKPKPTPKAATPVIEKTVDKPENN